MNLHISVEAADLVLPALAFAIWVLRAPLGTMIRRASEFEILTAYGRLKCRAPRDKKDDPEG